VQCFDDNFTGRSLVKKALSNAFLAIGAMIWTTNPGLAHSLGQEGSTDLTPPMIVYAEEIASMKNQFGPGGGVLRGVFNEMNLWNAGTMLQACFYDGEQDLQNFFVRAASRWLPGTSLKVDFGPSSNFRTCQVNSNSDIRISFAQKGSWSYIGSDILPDVVASPDMHATLVRVTVAARFL